MLRDIQQTPENVHFILRAFSPTHRKFNFSVFLGLSALSVQAYTYTTHAPTNNGTYVS